MYALMKFFIKHKRLLTLLIALNYVFSGNGLASLAVFGADYFDSHFYFPCRGFGCQCDTAGKELLNCRCDHTANIESSCCTSEESFLPSLSECCSEVESTQEHELLKNTPCGGLDDDESSLALKHPPTTFLDLQYKATFTSLAFTSKMQPV